MAMVTEEGLDPAILPQYIDLGDGSEVEEGDEGEDDAKMSDDDILKIIKSEVEAASELQAERQDNQAEATDYFYGRLPGMTQAIPVRQPGLTCCIWPDPHQCG